MPCRSDYPDDYFTSVERTVYKKMVAELDTTTRLLCSSIRGAIKIAKANGELPKDNAEYQRLMAIPGMRDWWTNHKLVDRKRKHEEAERKSRELRQAQQAVKKLTREAKAAKAKLARLKEK